MIANPPHNGAVTHHHDQVITPVNFNTKNTMKSKPARLTLLLLTTTFCELIFIRFISVIQSFSLNF